ncbi:MAG: hypothetical protein JRJ56_06960 [Deltaproteobacteria bacterium]|nr:hypothetical protein [Deltaproteobacteria bacterium]
MNTLQRKITIHKPGKQYTGHIAVPAEAYRTSDYFNRPALMKHPHGQSTADNYIHLQDVRITVDSRLTMTLETINIRVEDIIFFWDELKNAGTVADQLRAEKLRYKAGQQEMNRISIVTPILNGRFYTVAGTFSGLFRKAIQANFLALFEATITVFQPQNGGEWSKSPLPTPNRFVGFNLNYMESFFLKNPE